MGVLLSVVVKEKGTISVQKPYHRAERRREHAKGILFNFGRR